MMNDEVNATDGRTNTSTFDIPRSTFVISSDARMHVWVEQISLAFFNVIRRLAAASFPLSIFRPLIQEPVMCRMIQRRRGARRGFTLIELLVVIAIIAVLI